MNYLAHFYLAGRDEASLIGNLLGDFAKGPLHDQYRPTILDGIRQHRRIDAFTDAHPRTRMSRDRFSPERRRFAGVIVDLVYDHFLVRHWSAYSSMEFDGFVSETYSVLERHLPSLPKPVLAMVERMIDEDWLRSYRRLQALERALERIARRCKRENALPGAVAEIETRYRALEGDFLAFFPDIMKFATSGIGAASGIHNQDGPGVGARQ